MASSAQSPTLAAINVQVSSANPQVSSAQTTHSVSDGLGWLVSLCLDRASASALGTVLDMTESDLGVVVGGKRVLRRC